MNRDNLEELDVNSADAPRVDQPKPKGEGMDRALVARLIAGLIILALFVIFAIQNTASVEVSFLTWDFEIPRFLLMLISALVGASTWQFAAAVDRRRKRKAK